MLLLIKTAESRYKNIFYSLLIDWSMISIFFSINSKSAFNFSTLRFISVTRLLPFFDELVRNPKLFSYVWISFFIFSYARTSFHVHGIYYLLYRCLTWSCSTSSEKQTGSVYRTTYQLLRDIVCITYLFPWKGHGRLYSILSSAHEWYYRHLLQEFLERWLHSAFR